MNIYVYIFSLPNLPKKWAVINSLLLRRGRGLWRRRVRGLEAWMVIPVRVLRVILACYSVGWKLAHRIVCYVWVELILSHLSLYLVLYSLSYKTLS